MSLCYLSSQVVLEVLVSLSHLVLHPPPSHLKPVMECKVHLLKNCTYVKL